MPFPSVEKEHRTGKDDVGGSSLHMGNVFILNMFEFLVLKGEGR